MNLPFSCAAAMLFSGLFGQAEAATARELLVAATEAEGAFAHGEVVFLYAPEFDGFLDESDALGRPIDADALKFVFTFRDARHFRIVVSADGAHLRTIVSDGEYIDMGNGELWDYRFFEDEWGSANQAHDELFFGRFWIYPYVIQPHLFPLTSSYEHEYFGSEDAEIEFEDADGDAAGGRSIRCEIFPSEENEYRSWDVFGVTSEAPHRVTSWARHFDDEWYELEEWREFAPVGDGLLVAGVYRHSHPVDEDESASVSTIDFSASKFDHLPHASEFVIDRAGIDTVYKWRAPNPFAEELEYWIWAVFGWDVDIEPAVRKALWTTGIVMAGMVVLVVALEVRRRRKRRI